MSKARSCDGCGVVMILDHKGEDIDGADAAWIKTQIGDMVFDTCTRACTIEVLQRDDVVAYHDGYTANVMEVAAAINGAHDDQGDDDGRD